MSSFCEQSQDIRRRLVLTPILAPGAGVGPGVAGSPSAPRSRRWREAEKPGVVGCKFWGVASGSGRSGAASPGPHGSWRAVGQPVVTGLTGGQQGVGG